MSDTIDAPDTTQTPRRSVPRTVQPAEPSAAGSGERRVIDLDSVTDSVTESVTAATRPKERVIALPPVRDSSYWLG